MFDFAWYHLNGLVLEREAAGERLLLRDKTDTLVKLCNDGNVYCNVTNFDWTRAAMRQLWMDTLKNASVMGTVDGVFADHGTSQIGPASNPQLCNGKGTLRKCWNFTADFANSFNIGHAWLLNATQQMLAVRGGPVVDGPYSRWNIPACDFTTLREATQKGLEGSGPYVLEASRGGPTAGGDENCLAAFLCAMEK